MGYWPHGWDTATGERLGPWFDGFVGTEGKTNDLYEAIVTEGWTRIVLCAGAILSQDVTISANGAYVWSPFHPRVLSLGVKKITVSGSNVHLAGFKLNAASAVGLEITGSAWLERIAVEGCGSHGIFVNSTANDMMFSRVYVQNNGGDGIRIASGANALQVIGFLSYGNTGYGVNDLAGDSVLIGRAAGNTAGQINGSPDINQVKTT